MNDEEDRGNVGVWFCGMQRNNSITSLSMIIYFYCMQIAIIFLLNPYVGNVSMNQDRFI